MKQLDHKVFISKQNHRHAEPWCKERWGERWSVIDNRNGIWSCFWAGTRGPYAGMYLYIFENEQDAFWFALRWV